MLLSNNIVFSYNPLAPEKIFIILFGMLSRLYTATLIGLDCKIVEVEVDYRKGNSYFSIVGLADKSIQEARDRIPSAIRNSGAEFIPMQIVINLAPAELHKSGPSYDLPLAVGYLLASDQIKEVSSKAIFIGELALNGDLRAVNGILPIVDSVSRLGFTEVFLPKDNAEEAANVSKIKIFAASSIKEIIKHLNREEFIDEYKVNPRDFSSQKGENRYDFSSVRGQNFAKRALEVTAAGGHNVLLSGSPGSGKTLLSKCFVGILPEMTIEEKMEVTRIYSVAGLTNKKNPTVETRPFRSPHHTSSQAAMVGGGTFPKPGEISLSHRGVLFLDEFTEFTNMALEALRQPMEDRVVTISRANGSTTFPANFILVAAMNPCKCGYKGDPEKECVCSQIEISKYQKKLSGPILDRIDLMINVLKVKNEELFSNFSAENSLEIKKRVVSARNIQLDRYKGLNIFSNAEMGQSEIGKFVELTESSQKLLRTAVDRLCLSARSYFRVLRVARTIADLGGSEKVEEQHIGEALSYRLSSASDL